MTDGHSAPTRWRRRLLLGVFALIVGWAVAASVMVLLGVAAAERGRDELAVIEHRLDLADIFDGDAERLRGATDEFDAADRWLSHAVVRPFRFVPVVGRQLRTASSIADTTANLLHAGQTTLDTVSTSLDEGFRDGPERLALLGTLQSELDTLATQVARADLGPDQALVGPLRRARAEAAERIGELRTGLADAAVVLDSLEELLTGPSSYLVLAANNAEMRTGSGMFLSIGRVDFAGGRFTVDEFQPAVDLQLDTPVPLPGEIERLWGWAGPGREWRSLGFTPRFPVNAAIAAEMWVARGGDPVDGVLALDVLGLQQLLRATGPVDVGGVTVGADGVVPLLLREQYAGVDSADDNAARREELSAVASAVVGRLGQGAVDPEALAEGLRSAQRGRHLMLWSADRRQQRAWEIADVTGELHDRSLAVGVANIGGNKLDQFLDVGASIDVTAADEGAATVPVELEVRIENLTPEGQPDYVVGGDPSATYTGVVVASLPGSAEHVAVVGADVVASGPDGPSEALGVGIDVPRGASQTVRISFTLPAAVARDIALVPSARAPPMAWRVLGEPHGEVGQRLDLLPRRTR